MLKLKTKPSYKLFDNEIQYYDLFVSQDLSFVSGRTSINSNIPNGEEIKVVNNSNNTIKLLKAKTEDVIVKGKVFFKKELQVKSVNRNFNLQDGYYYNVVNFKNTYVEHNGDICFYCDKLSGYTVEHSFYNAKKTDKSITINTFCYIEGNYAIVDNEKYYVDFSNKSDPLKTFPYEIDEVVLYEPSNWKRETKFSLNKVDNSVIELDDLMYAGYENYVIYGGDKYFLKNIYKTSENGTMNYIGYGVEIDGRIYTDIMLNFVDENIFAIHKNINLQNSKVRISNDEYLNIFSSICSLVSDGNSLFLITKSESLDIRAGNYFVAKTNSPLPIKCQTRKDINDNEYVFYNNNRYDVESIYDYVIISDKKCLLSYDNDEKTAAHATVNGGNVDFSIVLDENNEHLASPLNKMYYADEEDYVKYGRIKGYKIYYSDGVKIGDDFYEVKEELNDDEEVIDRYIEIIDNLKYDLQVLDKIGSSTYVCQPRINSNEIYDEFESDFEMRSICDTLMNNIDMFSFTLRNDLFGDVEGFPENLLYGSLQEETPVNFLNRLNLSLFKINFYLNVKIPFVNGVGNNILKDDILNSAFINKLKDKSYNSIVDMEKDIYYPVYKDNSSNKFEDISEIRFNLHFRTRQLDTWKVIEDYVENESSENNSNWFICDYSYYKNAMEQGKKLQNVSDLVGYMNFTDSEVKNAAKKISKSFLRLSFYSTDDPNTQVLLSTSTIFMDEINLLNKIISLPDNKEQKYIRTQEYEKYYINGDDSLYKSDYCTVDGEIYKAYGEEYTFDNNSRLSSRLVVKDKYNSDTSSEGFYFYMFREFANNMRPKRIYLKIDFNHAGIGRIIPMILPRYNGTPLYLHKEEDLIKLKEGFEFKDIYKQLFIPIDVIFDDETNKYVYFLPDSLVENEELGVEKNIMEFNLFELKFKDESIKKIKNES